MRLIPVDPSNETHLQALYALLQERTADQSISHRGMPSWDDHKRFVADKVPHSLEDGELFYLFSYAGWYFICENNSRIVGSVYLTREDEIGVSIFKSEQRRGFGSRAVRMLMEQHGPRRYLANINPANVASHAMFEGLGFKLIQHTLEIRHGD